MRACSHTRAKAADWGLRSALAMVMQGTVPVSAGGNGTCCTGLPAACLAHQPSGGWGMPCFLQILCSATPEIENSFDSCSAAWTRRGRGMPRVKLGPWRSSRHPSRAATVAQQAAYGSWPMVIR
jgi:hypothetical protein